MNYAKSNLFALVVAYKEHVVKLICYEVFEALNLLGCE